MEVRGRDGRASKATIPSWRNLEKYENALKKMVSGRNIHHTYHGGMVVVVTIPRMADSTIKRHIMDGEWHSDKKTP